MATLLSGVSSNGAGTGVSVTGPVNVLVHGDTVYDGASVLIEIADTDTASDYQAVSFDGFKRFREGSFQQITINAGASASYYIRGNVSNSGSSTSITVVTL